MIMDSLKKDTFREIKNSPSRFLSILLIVGLGVFVLVGLISTGPVMRQSAQRRIISQNFPDILVTAPMGFEKEDYAILEGQNGIKEMEYGYDVDMGIANSTLTLKVMSLPARINRPILTEGRLPAKRGEILLDEVLRKKGFQIGDRLLLKKEVQKFKPLGKEKGDSLGDYEYEVVGFCHSLSYVMDASRGYSERGMGEIKGFGYILPQEFMTAPTMANFIYKDSSQYTTESQEYHDLISEKCNALEQDMKKRPGQRLERLKQDINTEIQKGEHGIADAKIQLSNADSELLQGQSRLQEGKKLYQEGKAQFSSKMENEQRKLAAQKEQLNGSEKNWKAQQEATDSKKKSLDDGKMQLNLQRDELSFQKSQWRRDQEDARRTDSQLHMDKSEIQAKENQLQSTRQRLDENWKKVERSKGLLEKSYQEYHEAESQLRENEARVQQGLNEIARSLGIQERDVETIALKLQQMSEGIQKAGPILQQAEQNEKQLAFHKSQQIAAQKELQNFQQQQLQLQRDMEQVQNQLQNSNLSAQERESLSQEQLRLENEMQRVNESLAQSKHTLEQLSREVEAEEKKQEEFQTQIQQWKELFPQGYDLEHGSIPLSEKLQRAKAAFQEIRQSEKELVKARVKLGGTKLKIDAVEKEIRYLTELAEKGESQYSSDVQDVQLKNEILEQNQKKLQQTQRELEEVKSAIYSGQMTYDHGKEQYDSNYKEYLEDQIQSDHSKREYEQNKYRYEANKKAYDRKESMGLSQFNEQARALYKSEEDLKRGKSQYRKSSEDVAKQISKGEEDIHDGYRYLELLKAPRYTVTPRYLYGNLYTYFDESKRVDNLSYIFPVFFFAISLLVCFTTMTRMVDEQRGIIGTYKALGYEKKNISQKFFRYGALASLIGGVLGSLGGSYILPKVIGVAYSTGTIFQHDLKLTFYPLKMVFAVFCGFFFTAIAARMTVNHILDKNAASLLRLKAPKKGSRILLEKISPLWNRMSFLAKVTARNLFRYKGRMIMTILGIMGCTAFLVLGFGIRGSVEHLDTVQFQDILKYNIGVSYDRNIDEQSYNSYKAALEKDGVTYAPFYQEGFTTNYKDVNQTVFLVIPQDPKKMADYIRLDQAKTYRPISLTDHGAVVTEKLAKLLHLRVGDTLEIHDVYDNDYRVEIADICEMYIGHNIFMTPKYYEKVFDQSFVPNTDFIKVNKNERQMEEYSDKLTNYRCVTSVVNLNLQRDRVQQFLYSISKVELVILVMSSLLAMVVLFNLTNINIAERQREISTIKVLGFYKGETTKYIYRETAALTGMGILLGLAAGKLLHYGILQIVVPLEFMLLPHLKVRAYVAAVFVTAIVSILMMFYFHRKINSIDMVESLKSNE